MVRDSKHVIVFDPLLMGHVIRSMRNGRVRIFNGNQWETLTQGRALFSQITLITFIVEPPKVYSE